jgi:phosphatidate cytidylyltransferase
MLLGSVWYSSWTFGLFFAAVQVKMLLEFYRMMRADGTKPAKWIGVAAGVIVFGLVYSITHGFQQSPDLFGYRQGATVYPALTGVSEETPMSLWLVSAGGAAYGWLVFGAMLFVVLVLKEIVGWPNNGRPFANIGATLAGLFYVSMPISFFNTVALGPTGYDYRRIFGLLFLVWASDIGAYAAGKTFGKHKLAPSISPGKTWEGWAGGFLLTLAMGWGLSLMMPDVPLTHRLIAAGVVAIFGPIGDLAESMLKRSVGVKDSGTMMPGHGGLLDRFDAFLLVLPVLALLQLLAG